MINFSLENQVYASLPRILSLYNFDSTNACYGIGDRVHWAWKMKDCANSILQGGIHGIARLLLDHKLKDYYDHGEIMNIIKSSFQGLQHITHSNGGLDQVYPYEKSFAATAFTFFDMLSALELLKPLLSTTTFDAYLKILEPLCSFLLKNHEKHGLISNHLAAAVAALYKWFMITGCKVSLNKSNQLLNIILENQSKSGWFKEYSGFDPGYQTLCLHFLADYHAMSNDKMLLEKIEKSIPLLICCFHPDGTFGGFYGSRNTTMYFPAGVDYFSQFFPDLSLFSKRMKVSIENGKLATLLSMDELNLVNMFNSYIIALINGPRYYFKKNKSPSLLPFEKRSFDYVDESSGLIIKRRENYNTYTILNFKKGGSFYHYSNGKLKTFSCGVLVRKNKNEYYSFREGSLISISHHSEEIKAEYYIDKVAHSFATPLNFLILRIFSLTILRFSIVNELFKKIIVRKIINKKTNRSMKISRRISFLNDEILIKDEILSSTQRLGNKIEIISTGIKFSPIHMASMGYWRC
jgi:hypothetical protein